MLNFVWAFESSVYNLATMKILSECYHVIVEHLTPVGGDVPIVGRLCDARLLVDEWRLERGEDDENPKATQWTKNALLSTYRQA